MDNRYRINRAARCLLMANFGLIAVLVFLLTAFVPLLGFFRHNIWVNSPIIGVFLAGVALVYLNLFRLAREERLANLIHRRSFVEKRDGWEPGKLEDRLSSSAVRVRVAQCRELAATGGPAHEEALAEIGAAEEGAKAATVRYLVGILVFLGLIGTFAGLLLTVDGVRGVINAMDFDPYADMGVSLRQLREDLTVPLQGMSTAFSTSLFGLGASVVLGFLGLQMTRAQEYFRAKLDDLTVIYLFPAFHVGEPMRWAAQPAAAPAPRAEAGPGELRALEAGARYLEAGARALHKDVESLSDSVKTGARTQQDLLDTFREMGNLLRMGTESLARLQATLEEDRQETRRLLARHLEEGGGADRVEGAIRDLEARAGEILQNLKGAAGEEAQRSQALQDKLEREGRTLSNHLTSSFSDLAELWDAAAREICHRISQGDQKLEDAIRSLQARGGSQAPPREGGGDTTERMRGPSTRRPGSPEGEGPIGEA